MGRKTNLDDRTTVEQSPDGAVFDKTKLLTGEIQPRIRELKLYCISKEIPMYVCVALKGNGKTIKFYNDCVNAALEKPNYGKRVATLIKSLGGNGVDYPQSVQDAVNTLQGWIDHEFVSEENLNAISREQNKITAEKSQDGAVFDKTVLLKGEIQTKVRDLKRYCGEQGIPMYLCLALKGEKKKVKYYNDCINIALEMPSYAKRIENLLNSLGEKGIDYSENAKAAIKELKGWLDHELVTADGLNLGTELFRERIDIGMGQMVPIVVKVDDEEEVETLI